MKRGFLNSDKAKTQPLYPASNENVNVVEVPSSLIGASDSTIGRETFQLSSGTVENTALPEIFKPDEVLFDKLNARNSDLLEDALPMTTIPSITIADLPDPGGHSEWIVTSSTKKRVFKAPGFPLAVPKTTGPLTFAVRSTQDMGWGVFATRDIKVGELILVERPLLILPLNFALLAPSVSVPDDRSGMYIYQMGVLSQAEEALEVAVGRMSPQNQMAFMALANTHMEDGSGPLMGVVRTNGFHIGELYDGPQLLQWSNDGYTGICDVGSRINHSCMPNICYAFSLASFSFQFRASRDIDAREQLFHSYCNTQLSAAQRKADLAPYGINCSCSACVHATPETDKLRLEYSQRVDAFYIKSKTWTKAQGVDKSALKPLLKFQDAVIKEGLNGTRKYARLLAVLSQLYIKLGRRDSAMYCLEKLKGYYEFT